MNKFWYMSIFIAVLCGLCVFPAMATTYHADLDVKNASDDPYYNYLYDTNIGIKDSNNQWYNTTCTYGACGFTKHGTGGTQDLVLGDYYTLAASKTGFDPYSTTIHFTYDFQLTTIYLYMTAPPPEVNHLDIDIKDSDTYDYIAGASYGIKDSDNEWYNSTCTYGACGFTVHGTGGTDDLVIGDYYTIAASKSGYVEETRYLQFTEDHQFETLYLDPEVVDKHLLLNVKYSNGSWVYGSTIGIYDPVHEEWRNSTCSAGACGFIDSGATHQYPLEYYHNYGLAASLAGYISNSTTIEFVSDYQTVTLTMLPVSEPSYEINLFVRNASDEPSHAFLTDSTVGIYDVENDEWRNSTSPTGSVTFPDSGATHQYPLVIGHNYILAASKTGFVPLSSNVTFTTNGQTTSLYLYLEEEEDLSQHLDVDIKDASTGSYLSDTNLMLQYPNSTWYNTTCAYGACGFNETRGITLGEYYTVAASKTGYTGDSEYVHYLTDHQLTTLYLTQEESEDSIDLQIKDSGSHAYIQGSTIGIYDAEYDEWRNSTCSYGECSFADSGTTHQYPLEVNKTYQVAVSAYMHESQLIEVVFPGGHHFVPVYLVQIAPSGETIDLQIKDAVTHSYISNTQIGIYDMQYHEWRNSTCVNGECSFADSGATHQYPFENGNQYQVSVAKESDGYIPQLISITYPPSVQYPPDGLIQVWMTTEENLIWFDIKDINQGTWVDGMIGIYDPIHDEWRNSSTYGSGQFADSGATHQYPLVVGNYYTIAAFNMSGYSPVYYDMQLTETPIQSIILYATPLLSSSTTYPGRISFTKLDGTVITSCYQDEVAYMKFDTITDGVAEGYDTYKLTLQQKDDITGLWRTVPGMPAQIIHSANTSVTQYTNVNDWTFYTLTGADQGDRMANKGRSDNITFPSTGTYRAVLEAFGTSYHYYNAVSGNFIVKNNPFNASNFGAWVESWGGVGMKVIFAAIIVIIMMLLPYALMRAYSSFIELVAMFLGIGMSYFMGLLEIWIIIAIVVVAVGVILFGIRRQTPAGEQ